MLLPGPVKSAHPASSCQFRPSVEWSCSRLLASNCQWVQVDVEPKLSASVGGQKQLLK